MSDSRCLPLRRSILGSIDAPVHCNRRGTFSASLSNHLRNLRIALVIDTVYDALMCPELERSDPLPLWTLPAVHFYLCRFTVEGPRAREDIQWISLK